MFPLFLVGICISVANLSIHFVQFGFYSTLGLTQYLFFVCCFVYYKRNMPMNILSYDTIYFGSAITFMLVALNVISLLDIMEGDPLNVPLISDWVITTVCDMIVTVVESTGKKKWKSCVEKSVAGAIHLEGRYGHCYVRNICICGRVCFSRSCNPIIWSSKSFSLLVIKDLYGF